MHEHCYANIEKSLSKRVRNVKNALAPRNSVMVLEDGLRLICSAESTHADENERCAEADVWDINRHDK